MISLLLPQSEYLTVSVVNVFKLQRGAVIKDRIYHADTFRSPRPPVNKLFHKEVKEKQNPGAQSESFS